MSEEIYVGDEGTDFVLTIEAAGVAINLTGGSALMRFQRSDGTVFERTGTIPVGTDGKVHYATVEGDLDMAGQWRYQAFCTVSGNDWNSGIGEFIVKAPLTPTS